MRPRQQKNTYANICRLTNFRVSAQQCTTIHSDGRIRPVKNAVPTVENVNLLAKKFPPNHNEPLSSDL